MFRYPGPMRDPEDPRLVPPVDRPPQPPPSLFVRLGRLGLILLAVAAVLVVLPVLALAGVYVLGDLLNPPCTDDDRAAWATIHHYRDVEPEAIAGLAGCVANFDPGEPPARIISHYRSAFKEAGWQLDEESYSSGTMPPEPPDELASDAAEVPGVFHMIRATRQDHAASVSWEKLWVRVGQPDGQGGWELVTRAMVSVYPVD